MNIRQRCLLGFVAVSAFGLAACGSATDDTTAKTQAGAVDDRGSGTTTTTAPAPDPNAARRFIGHWFVHGSTLDITSATEATETVASGFDCTPAREDWCLEKDRLSLELAPDGESVTATIVGIDYVNGTTGAKFSSPFPGASQAVGDSVRLEFVAPHLMKATVIKRQLGTENYGNAHWCQDGIAPNLRDLCGA
jgi:hypothetical protein